ncbi:hypothetical protein Vadar_033219 [Vaccinium darrowii]|uniref:Uncharacterized protein n=1 Tax=Vaccinium darrowii TaxID=229202 RepID=A0ACB7YRR8_9ERIC|nr:hypothetical protein Vadar_033219 [Vaccinium darrowii]
MIFKYIQTLDIRHCDSLRYVFPPTLTKSIPQLRELKVWRCKMMSIIVAEENGLGESWVDEVEFPRLERLELRDLPNLTRFCHSTHPLKLPLLSKMVISKCPSMDAFSLGHVSAPNLSLPGISWNGDVNNAIQLLQKEQKKEEEEERRNREEERRNWEDRWRMWEEKRRIMVEEERRMEADVDEDKEDGDDKSKSWKVGTTQCRLVAMPERIDGPHKVAQLLYTNSGNGVLALGCNGSMRLWKWGSSKHDSSGKWQPASGLAMTNDVTGAKLEEAVPCIAVSKNDRYVISACGGMISVFDMCRFKVVAKSMPPPPASTFLAFFPQDSNLIAIGMEDSTIRIYDVRLLKVKSTLKGHQKRITGFAFSTILKLLVSSGADAQHPSTIVAWKNSLFCHYVALSNQEFALKRKDLNFNLASWVFLFPDY